MNPTITAFECSPDRGRGLARDMRVRCALEEVGQPHDVRLLSFAQMKEPAHLALQPFGQIPTYEGDGVVMFETGAILLHIAQTHPGLLPDEAAATARATSWLFAALSTIEPPIVERFIATFVERERSWADERLPLVDERIRARLAPIANHLGDSEWLDGDFSVADLMMVTVLQRLAGGGPIVEFPTLQAYIKRGEDRPAYKRAFAAQLAVFEASQQK